MLKKLSLLSFMMIVSVLLSACYMPLFPRPTQDKLVGTLTAQTLEAMMTQVAGNPTSTQGAPVATATTAPLLPSSTPAPTNTQVVIPPTSTNTPVPLPCDAAAFVADVNIPDGTQLSAGQRFTKTWRLKNIGTCTWNQSYGLAFIDGNAMGAPAVVNFTGVVPPGQTVDLSIELTAPTQPGSYRGNWKVRNPNGVLFGTGAGSFPFYADIRVSAPVNDGSAYSFVYNLCQADWSSGAGTLPCSGTDGDSRGFVIFQEKPRLETGAVENEPALLTVPQAINDGVIRGRYPSYTVKTGDRFRTVVGCEYNAKNCAVRFQLDYQIDNGPIQTLAYWDEKNEGGLTSVDLDLNSLAGKSVRFILTTLANGSSSGDRAQWLKPRIVNVPPVTPTFTPTATATQTPTPTLTPTATGVGYP